MVHRLFHPGIRARVDADVFAVKVQKIREACLHHLRRAAAGGVQPPFQQLRRTKANHIAHGGFGHSLARSEEHTSELQSLMRISYAVFCLKKKKEKQHVYLSSTYISTYHSSFISTY